MIIGETAYKNVHGFTDAELHRNSYLNDTQYKSIYADCEELVKILVHRCKKLDGAE